MGVKVGVKIGVNVGLNVMMTRKRMDFSACVSTLQNYFTKEQQEDDLQKMNLKFFLYCATLVKRVLG